MLELTNEMIEMFSKQLPIIATVNEDGTPNVGPKRTARISEGKIVFNENTGGRTFENIKRDGNVTIIIVDWDKLDGYRFVGKANVYTEGSEYEKACQYAEQKGMKAPKAVVVVDLSRIDTLKSGPTAGQTIK